MGTTPVLDDPVRKAIAARMQEMGLEAGPISREMGYNHAYLYQFLKAGKPAALPESARRFLSERLHIPEDQLRSDRRSRASSVRPNARIGAAAPLGGAPRIPVFGQAVGGPDGRFVLNGTRIADVLTPPALVGVRDAYAVYVAGDSMDPRYRSGETVYVHPHLPVRQGDFVVVQIARDQNEPPEGYVKEFVSMDSRRLRLRQFRPRKIIEFQAAHVLTIHRIVMAGTT